MVESAEQWKDITEYPGYRISSFGRVYNTQSQKYSNGTINSRGYILVWLSKDGKRKQFYMHRIVAKYFLQEFDENLQVDHIDRNKINNNIINLRMATHQQNQQNMSKQKNATSKYLGVSLFRNGKWKAQITINYKVKHLGLFESEKEAAIAYNQQKVKLGNHVNLNEITDDEDDNQQE